MQQPWNNLVEYFTASNASSTDNVEIVEPELIRILLSIHGKTLIDFGCGTGSFARRIACEFDRILGYDTSESMIDIAKRKPNPSNLTFSSTEISLSTFINTDIMTAEFVFQFMNNAEIRNLLQLIDQSNLNHIVLAQDNTAFIQACIQNGLHKFSRDNNQYFIHLGDEIIPMFLRDDQEYEALLPNFTLQEVTHLSLTNSFLDKFPEYKDYPSRPAYTVMHFVRKVSYSR